MPYALTAKVKIALERGSLFQTELADQEDHHGCGDLEIGAREDAQEPGRTQHEGEAEAIMVASQPIGDLPVAPV